MSFHLSLHVLTFCGTHASIKFWRSSTNFAHLYASITIWDFGSTSSFCGTYLTCLHLMIAHTSLCSYFVWHCQVLLSSLDLPFDLPSFIRICCIYCKLIHLCLVFVGVWEKEQKKVESGRRYKAEDLESCRRFVEHTSPFLNDELGEALIVYFLWILVITCECQ